MPDGQDPAATPASFEALLYPNQPPPARNLVVLLAMVAGVAIGISIGFFLAGAWPVIGFVGLEVVLLVGAMLWVRKAATYAEHIRLDHTGLHVSSLAGRRVLRRWRFEPYWVQVRLDEDRPGEPTLRLAAHGRTLTIGRFLNTTERCAFADALERALAPYRPGSA